MIIDPQELDFHSVFEEIDVEEVSEITRAIGFNEVSAAEEPSPPPVLELDEEIFKKETQPPPPPISISPANPRLKSERKIPAFLVLGGGVMILVLAYFFLLSSGPGRMKIVFNPPDSTAYLDGKALSGSSPIILNQLKPRNLYRVRVVRDGYQSQEKEVRVYPGWTSTPSFELKESREGVLDISSTPSQAAIFIDGQATGLQTPARIPVKNLSFPLTLGLSKGGAPVWEKRLETAPMAVEKFNADLEKAYGRLDIETSPSGATVFLQGLLLGKTPLLSQQVEAGKKLELRIELKGFIPAKAEIKLAPGQSERIYRAMVVAPSR